MKKQATFRMSEETLKKLNELQKFITPRASKGAIAEDAINNYYDKVIGGDNANDNIDIDSYE